MKTYLDYEGLAVLAHRGGADESFENTLESFEYSKSLGCKFIETDVQISSDGIPYIFHDNDLKRICNISKKFDSLKSDEIDNITIFENYKIPRLEDTLNKFPELSFQIDFKTDEVVESALDVIQKTNSSDRVCIASFSSKRLERVRSISPNLCISMGPNEVFKTLLSRYKLTNSPLIGDCLQVPMKYYGLQIVTKKFVEYLKSKKIKIMVWTINDVETFNYLISLNVDGIITDKPKLLFDTLRNN
tara:strand:- start:8293 stop:9027 length:735 start_codon:yes stop_codon:yes gene_type:complete